MNGDRVMAFIKAQNIKRDESGMIVSGTAAIMDTDFGRACYVDSAPLPDDIQDNPYNALRCESGKGCSVQKRLALVLDDATGLPVWFDIIAGNLLDVSTLDWFTRMSRQLSALRSFRLSWTRGTSTKK